MYAYDPAVNRSSVTSAGSTTIYTYDRANRIQSVQSPPINGSSTRAPSSNAAGWTSWASAYTSDNAYATTDTPCQIQAPVLRRLAKRRRSSDKRKVALMNLLPSVPPGPGSAPFDVP